MTTPAYNFGRQARIKIAQGHQPRPPVNNQPPTRGITPGNRGFFQEWLNPPKPSSTAGAPTNSPYLNTLDRWYNPWTKQTGREAGEQGLMRAGQTAMGVGAAAGAAAGGLAAAPALGGSAVGATPLFGTTNAAGAMLPTLLPGSAATTAGTAASAAAAGSQTPAGQNLWQRGSQMFNQAMPAAQNMMNRANQAMHTYDTRVKPVLDRVGYKPQDLAMDGYAAATGNFDKIKGPGWGGVKMPSMPAGAPSLPRPLAAWKGMAQAGANVMPRPMANALGFKPPAAGRLMQQ